MIATSIQIASFMNVKFMKQYVDSILELVSFLLFTMPMSNRGFLNTNINLFWPKNHTQRLINKTLNYIYVWQKDGGHH